MATYGKLVEFDPDSADWQQYVERQEFYFVSNFIEEEDQKRAVFLSSCGKKAYALLRDLCQPGKPGELPLSELLKKLSDHFTPKPSVIVERFKFHSKVTQPGQSVLSFLAELRRLTEHCGFGAAMDDMIRDRLVCGINDDCMQRRILAEPDDKLTLARAVSNITGNEPENQAQETVGQAPPQEAPTYLKDYVVTGAE
uniref:Tick transposon n=1 Tax=Acanthochromis polyacanthus TaxID=80966 RepID=A0A3Q1FDP4_9TELE